MLTLCKSTVLGAAFLAGVAIAACQPPGPQIAALPSADAPPAPGSATPPSIGHDGSYAGLMTEVGAGLAGHASRACVSRRPVRMRIERDNATISYSDWNGRTIEYRGKVDSAGRINVRDANEGFRSVLVGQIADHGFTGHMERDYCHYALTMPAEAVEAGSPVR